MTNLLQDPFLKAGEARSRELVDLDAEPRDEAWWRAERERHANGEAQWQATTRRTGRFQWALAIFVVPTLIVGALQYLQGGVTPAMSFALLAVVIVVPIAFYLARTPDRAKYLSRPNTSLGEYDDVRIEIYVRAAEFAKNDPVCAAYIAKVAKLGRELKNGEFGAMENRAERRRIERNAEQRRQAAADARASLLEPGSRDLAASRTGA